MKAIITNFYLGNARNGEHYRLHRQILQVADAEFAEEFGITALFQAYNAAFDVENECHRNSRKFENTELVESLDQDRDSLFTFSYQVAYYGRNLPIPVFSEAARRMFFQLDPYKGIQNRSYEDNSAGIFDFLEKMEQPQNIADAETLHLTTVFSALKEKNEAFEEAYFGRSQELLTRKTSMPMKVARRNLDLTALDYFNAINAMYQVNELVTKDAEKKARLEKVIDDINTYIIQLQANIARRLNGQTSETDTENKPADGTTTTPDTDTPDTGDTETPDTGTDTGNEGNTPTPDDDEEVVG